MEMTESTTSKQATPEYILSVLTDSHRQQCEFDPEADREAVLTFETTVDEWRLACDLLAWRQLGRAYDEAWNLGYTDEEWHSVLEPADLRTLRDVCDFIARRATMKEIAAVRILGKDCKPAGAFFAVCSELRKAGADVSGITPSTPLAEYTRKYPGVFLGPISQLSPNKLPLVRVHAPLHNTCLWGFGMGGLVGFVLLCFGLVWPPLMFVGYASLAVMAVSYASVWVVARLPAKSVTFGRLLTFRDLAKAIAHEAQ
ncbi:MAG: hypothetical protein GXY74_08435 [Phycisphaerae bacterium]|nr:hypothetical protein [Phycisphaerae bacterium]